VRPQVLLCVPALALLSPSGFGTAVHVRRAVGVAGLALASALVVVAPWTLRNCARMDGCALVSTNAGWNLAIGSFPRATGRYEALRKTDGCGFAAGQVQQDRCWMREGVRWIRQDPLRWIALAPKKLAFTFDNESFPVSYLSEASPSSWPEPRRVFWWALLSGSHRLLLAAAALGVVARPSIARARENPVPLVVLAVVALVTVSGFAARGAFWPLAVLIPILAVLPLPGQPDNGRLVGYLAWSVAAVCATHVVFFGEDRYHMMVTPALCALAACALRPPLNPDGA
jgi:hypothetical protein